jgi:phosphoglycolate phosphatase
MTAGAAAANRDLAGILFDKDGTLFDFRQSWAGWTLRMLDDLAPGDAAAQARLAGAIGFSPAAEDFAPDSPVIAGTSRDIAAALAPILDASRRAGLADRLDRLAAHAPMTEAVPLRPLLTGLRRRRLALGVATNDSEAAARAHLDRHGILDLFDFVAGCDSGFGAKPEPGMCLAFAAHLGAPAARLLMVGDSRHDLISAVQAGLRRVAVLTGIADKVVLAPLAEAVLPDIGGLPDWLDGAGSD